MTTTELPAGSTKREAGDGDGAVGDAHREAQADRGLVGAPERQRGAAGDRQQYRGEQAMVERRPRGELGPRAERADVLGGEEEGTPRIAPAMPRRASRTRVLGGWLGGAYA